MPLGSQALLLTAFGLPGLQVTFPAGSSRGTKVLEGANKLTRDALEE